MNKSSILFFGVLVMFIVFLYRIFPLSGPTEISEIPYRKENVIEEKDPMTQVFTPVEVDEETLEEDDLTEEEEEKWLKEEEQNKKKKKEKERRKKEEKRKKREKEERRKEEEKRKKREKEERRKKEEKRKKEERRKTPNTKKIDKIIRYSRSKLGKPFRRAGTTDKGYDCSGLIMTSYLKQNVKLPRASYQMAKKGTLVKLKSVKRGDLLFFGTKSEAPKRISHVGMVTKVKEGKIYFIHSSEKVGVILNTMNEGYYRKRFLKAKRYLK